MTAFENALENFKEAADIINLDENIRTILTTPENIVEGTIEVSGKEYKAYRSQFNSFLGPYKGGIRFHPMVSLDEVKALSFWMVYKCIIANIPYGGGKGGIIVNPKELSKKELEELSRKYLRLISNHIGPKKDIPAPDVNTNPQIMAWMVDEYSKIKGYNVYGVLTGKPIELGGSLGRTEATGRGGAILVEAMAEKYNIKSIAIQGIGNVGYWAAKILKDMGFKIVALSDSKGAIYNPEGLDPEKVLKHKEENGIIENYPESKNITNEELLELEVDALIPSAVENVITKDNAEKIKAKIIFELANGPITPDADEILEKNNIEIIPDVLANSGGVTVSYFEWVQNNYGYYWEENEVNEKLKKNMLKALNNVLETKEKFKVPFRKAAYIYAINKQVKVGRLRGKF